MLERLPNRLLRQTTVTILSVLFGVSAATRAQILANPEAQSQRENPSPLPQPPQPAGVVGGIGPSQPRNVPLTRPASDWTLDERLAKRCDQRLASARAHALRARVQSTAQPPFVSGAVDIISGRSNPELFLPHELFETVVTGAAFDPGWRLTYKPLVKAAGLPPDFWAQLEFVSAAYIADLREKRAVSTDKSLPTRALAIARTEQQERKICRDRALALRAARTEFGHAFDHFMYEYVAPNRTDYLDEISDARLLRSREEGCR